MGGIEPLALLNEPTAAAMGYARRHNADGQKILVFDFGGGTLDVTLLESRSGVFFEQASSGVARLGGIDFDNAIYRHIADELPQSSTWTSIDRDRIMLQIEHAKIRLSSDADETVISDPALPAFRLTRPKFNEITGHLVERLRSPIERVLADLRMSAGDVDQLLLVGGTSKVPAVRQHVSEIMGREPATGIDPMTAVGQGAAIAAAILTGELDDTDFFVSTEHALGTVVADTQSRTLRFSPIIPRNQKLPARQSDIFVPVQDFQESVHVAVLEGDPDQPIAHPDNLLLAEFDVPLEPARPAEDVQIELTYSYDTDGLLHVDVADYQSGEALTDRVTLAFTGALGGKDLVEIAARVRSAVDDGTAANGQSVQASQELDPASAKLITRARSKVIPFVDDDEGSFLRDLVDQLQSASDGDIEDARRALEDALRPYSYLY
jgi:molecular chaperone DnaK (HSP70)